jgi:hypothetical protein
VVGVELVGLWCDGVGVYCGPPTGRKSQDQELRANSFIDGTESVVPEIGPGLGGRNFAIDGIAGRENRIKVPRREQAGAPFGRAL